MSLFDEARREAERRQKQIEAEARAQTDAAAEALRAEAEAIAKAARAAAEEARQAAEKAAEEARQAADKARQAAEKAERTARSGVESAVTKTREIIDKLASDGRRVIDTLTNTMGGGELDRSGAPDLSIGRVNGQRFYTPEHMLILVVTSVNNGERDIVIETHQPEVIEAFRWLEGHTKEEIGRRIFERYQLYPLPVSAAAPPPLVPPEVLIIGAVFGGIATVMAASVPVIFALTVLVFASLLGVAIIYAVHKGYDIKNVELSVEDGKPKIKFSLEKRAN